jgi:hypothetical protein
MPTVSWLRRRLLREGSTRALGLIRVALALILWARWGDELMLSHGLDPDRIALGVAFFASSTAMLLGLWTRAATAATAAVVAGMVYGYGRLGGVEDWNHHHTTLLAHAVMLLALTPCGRSFSVDRWRSPDAPERGPLWATDLLGLQVSTLYLWSAVDKTRWAFLSGASLEQVFLYHYAGSDWPDLPWLRAALAGVAVGVTALEYLLSVGLWVRRWQPVLVPAGLLLHGLFYVLIPVNTFTVTMWALYLVFLDPEVVHRAVDRLTK